MSHKKKVFLSSTCYDLAEIRSSIEATLNRMGYLPILSDRSNFVVDPSMHRHDVCVAQAKLADLMILLIDQRFGAPYYAQPDIGVTWAEFRAARESRIPMICLVRKQTWDERDQARHDKSFQPKYADPRLFKFLTEIQDGRFGIWMEMFETVDDIVRRLENLGILFGGPWIFRDVGEPRMEQGRILVSSLSPEAQHLVCLLFGADMTGLQESDFLDCLNAIPDDVRRGSEDLNTFLLHGFCVLAERAGDQGELIIRPTSLGMSLREEFERLLSVYF